jgi:hypothetical protein
MENIKIKSSNKMLPQIKDFKSLTAKMYTKYKGYGSGSFSDVFANKDNVSVIKVTKDSAYINFLEEVVLKHENIHFPKIYEVVTVKNAEKHVGKIIVMEKLHEKAHNQKNKTTKKIFSVANKYGLQYFCMDDNLN